MIGRHQLPVASPITLRTLMQGALGLLGRDASEYLVDKLSAAYGAREVALTDSGTSALVLALNSVGPPGTLVAMPAYGCVDLVAAAVGAGVRIILYDLDPSTLSPELESVETAIASGAKGVVVAHLFGYPADVSGVQTIADRFGARVIEDAAQGTGGVLYNKVLGAFGPLTVLSFGRGKGVTGGRGGALLALDEESARRVSGHLQLKPAVRGWRDWFIAAAQWSLGRPNLYGVPASLPALRLGETIYRDAPAPREISRSAAAMVPTALALSSPSVAMRRATAEVYRGALQDVANASRIEPLTTGQSGFLRYAVIMDDEARRESPRLGIYRSYPAPLFDEPAARPVLTTAGQGYDHFPGARILARRLFTLPTHHLMSKRDIGDVCAWLRTSIP